MFDETNSCQNNTTLALKGARKLLGEGPFRWTKLTISRDERDYPCEPNSSSAVSFCLAGAIRRSEFLLGQMDNGLISFDIQRILCRAIVESSCWKHLEPFQRKRVSFSQSNDYHATTYEQVLQWLDRAIELSEGVDSSQAASPLAMQKEGVLEDV